MEEQKKPGPEKPAERKADAKEALQQKPAEKKEQADRKPEPRPQAPQQKPSEKKTDPQLPAQQKSGEQRTFQEIRDFSIALDDYDDIFSDFDPRPYNRRELSGDFLKEVEKRDLEAGGEKIDVLLFLPKALRNPKSEELILKRVKEHYAAEIKQVSKKVQSRRNWGIVMTFGGLALLLVEAYVVTTPEYAAVRNLFTALLVPLGWFTMWTGLDRIVLDPQDDRRRLEMLERMRKATFIFKAYEDEKKE
jgi:hypothetical protein